MRGNWGHDREALVRWAFTDKDGRYSIRVGPGAMPGPYDTYIAYGRGWANVSNTPFREYKHWVHEGGISTPLVVHWPAGIKRRGELERQPGHLIDVMATALDVTGAKYPEKHKGKAITPYECKSLKPIFEGKQREAHEAIYWEHEGNAAVRIGKWKLVRNYPRPWELYDIEADRTELHDLASSHPDRVADMAAQYEAWAKRCGVIDREKIVALMASLTLLAIF